jgi:hypothetical protein
MILGIEVLRAVRESGMIGGFHPAAINRLLPGRIKIGQFGEESRTDSLAIF